MTDLIPISSAVLDAVLVNSDDESVLRIGEQGQALILELKNQSTQPVELGGAGGPTTVVVTFRPGALTGYDSIAVTDGGWSGGPDLSAAELIPITLTHTDLVTLAPGETERIELTGVVASGHGGSRNTRVDIELRDVHLPGEGPVSGRRLAHLSILHEQIPTASVAGGRGTSGPFEARIENGAQIVNGGNENSIIIVLQAISPVAVSTLKKAGIVDDEVSRFEFAFDSGEGDSVSLSGVTALNGGGWSADGLAINYSQVKAKTLEGDFLRLVCNVKTNLQPGIYPIRIKHFNFGKLDGTVTLLVQVTAIGVAASMHKGGQILATAGLDVAGDGRFTGDLTVSGSAGAQAYQFGRWKMQDNENKSSHWISFRRDKNAYASFWFSHPKSNGMDLGVAEIGGGVRGQSLSIISRSGKLGINNRKPSVALDVTGDGRFTGDLTVSGSISRSGKLGINNLFPAHALDVAGDGRFTRDLTVSGRLNLGHGWYIEVIEEQMWFMKKGVSKARFLINANGSIASPNDKLRRIT